jgi:hypothetical protein
MVLLEGIDDKRLKVKLFWGVGMSECEVIGTRNGGLVAAWLYIC